MRPLPELPRSQVALVALLVDNPHLATLAEQARVEDYVTDPRLQPIVRAVLEAAFAGDQPGEGELLAHLDLGEQRKVHDAVFAGTFRDVEHPQHMLATCIHTCQCEQLKHRSKQMNSQILHARERGENQQAVELTRDRLLLNRQLSELERNPPIPPAATRH